MVMEEQREILRSLEEAQKIQASITDHQKVLQLLQELLARNPPPYASATKAIERPGTLDDLVEREAISDTKTTDQRLERADGENLDMTTTPVTE